MAEIWGAAIIAGGAIIGGVVSASGSAAGAAEEAGAAESAQQIQQNEFNTITQQESPYMQSGYSNLNELNYLMGTGPQTGQGINPALGAYGSLNKPFTTADWQQLSPSYGFQLQQGGQGVLNQDSGAQGAESGASLKDLMSFNQGLASTSFNNAFNMYQTQQSNIFQRLQGTAQLGQNAAANTGQQGTALAGNEGQAAIAAGNAIGTGMSNVGNALGNSANQYAWLSALSNNNADYTTANAMLPGTESQMSSYLNNWSPSS